MLSEILEFDFYGLTVADRLVECSLEARLFIGRDSFQQPFRTGYLGIFLL